MNMTEMNGHLDPNTDRIRNFVAALPHSTVFRSEMLVGLNLSIMIRFSGTWNGYAHSGTYTKD